MSQTNRRRPGSGITPEAARTIALQLESLEDRCVPAVIGGLVYSDANGSGLFDAGEAGIAGSTLQLKDASGQVIASAATIKVSSSSSRARKAA